MNRYLQWATNALHAAGANPWSGQPTKAEPAAGKIATGRLPEELPPSEETNWMRWAVALVLSAACSMRVLNWLVADVALTNANNRPIDCGYDEIANRAWVVSEAAVGVSASDDSTGGLTWNAGAAPAISGPTDCAEDNAQTRVCVGTAFVGQIRYSTAFGAWAAWAASPGVFYTAIEHDGAGLWIAIDTNGNVYSSTGPAVPFALVAGQPGAAISARSTIMHSRHYALEVDQYDAGNPIWIISQPAGGPMNLISWSVDGINFTPWAAMAVPAGVYLAYRWAYSAVERKWIAFDRTGQAIYVSTDNGVSWSGPTAIPMGPAMPAAFPRDEASLAGDRGSDLVLAVCDGSTNFEIWVSSDTGRSWTQIYIPTVGGVTTWRPEHIVAWYGGGRFFVDMNNTTSFAKPQIYTSARMN